MKLSLVVLTPGKMKGKPIAVQLSQFLIGRDPQCHLRPASPIVSNRHCALLTRKGKVFVRDFNSTNGTFVNEKAIKKETQLHDQDLLRVGPVAFSVRIETEAAVPVAVAKKPTVPVDDEAAAALLLSLQEQADGETGPVDEGAEVPGGSTVMDIIHSAPEPTPLPDNDQKDVKKTALGDTSSAADAILRRYLQRPRK
jgi:predicted component of type VI protein secretion system